MFAGCFRREFVRFVPRVASLPTRRYCADAATLFGMLQSNSEDPGHLKRDPLFQTRTEGEVGTKDYKVAIIQSTPGMMDMHRASPYFAIPLYSREDEELLHMVCEIPKGTTEKMEVKFEDKEHSIMQDLTKEGKLRHYKHGPILWNYGMLPQTYEDPDTPCEKTGLQGDGDPLDIIEIGSSTLCTGEVIKIKPLGVLPLIDEGEIDWKVIGINSKDELASHLNDITDVDDVMPGMLSEIKEWFRIYKLAEGKEENKFALDGNYQNKQFALEVIAEAHERVFDIIPRIFQAYEREQKKEKAKDRPLRGRRPRPIQAPY